MTAIADRYRSLAAAFTATVDAIPPAAWDRPSPCEGWSAQDVLRHVVETEVDFLRRQDLPVPEVDTSDPAAAWPPVRDAVQAVLDDPGTAGRGFDGWFGPTTVEETIDGFYSFDLVIHRWDLARATGLTEHEPITPDEIDRVHTDTASYGDALRMPGVCGPAVAVPDDASPQDRLLGYLGRRP